MEVASLVGAVGHMVWNGFDFGLNPTQNCLCDYVLNTFFWSNYAWNTLFTFETYSRYSFVGSPVQPNQKVGPSGSQQNWSCQPGNRIRQCNMPDDSSKKIVFKLHTLLFFRIEFSIKYLCYFEHCSSCSFVLRTAESGGCTMQVWTTLQLPIWY